MASMADDARDELYWANPAGFTALRTRLSAAAKQRGDTAAARRISTTNRPTKAAWIVNRLAIGHPEVKQRLTDLGDRLRAAHAAMDGDRIRDLSAEQRKLVDDLARAAFEAAELTNPSAAVRDDVTGTLQAAIADPDVTAALGRLTKPQCWSGFGALGDTGPVLIADRGAAAPKRTRSTPAKKTRRDDELRTARRQDDNEQKDQLRAALTEAERATAKAGDALSESQAELAATRLRHNKAVQSLREAERDLSIAEDAYAKAKQASRDTAESVREAKARLRASAPPRRHG